MTILQKPADLNLSSNLPEFIISSAAPIDFILKKGGDILLSARYVPGDDSKVIIDIKDIVESSLSCNLRDQEQAYVQDQLTATFVAEIDGTSVTFVVVKGGVDRLATSASAFLKSNWLTWQPQTKYVTYYTPEFLTFYAEVAMRVMVKAYFTSGDETNEETRELYNASAGSAYTVPVQYAVISELFGSRLPSFYDVWFATSEGTRLSYIQRYVAGGTMSETEDWIIFENSLGGLDTFRAYGETELTAEHAHNLAELGDETEEYRVDTLRNFSKSTGWLDDRQRKWLLDFFPSPQKYLYTRNFLRRIIVSDDTTSYVENVLPTGYSFTYRFADAKPLLNLARVEDLPIDLHIEVPELGSFTIPPRLVEFPSQNLSEGVLFPVQNPYSENWATTSIGQIFDYTVKGIIQIGPAVFGIVIYDGLDSGAADVCLSANQGRILKEAIDNIARKIKGVALDRLVKGDKEFFLNPDGSLSTSSGILKFNGSIIATGEVSAYGPGKGEGGTPGTVSVIIIDNLTSTSKEAALSANMGRELKRLIDEKNGSMNANALWQLLGDATTEQINKSHLTDALKDFGTHKHDNLDVLNKITQNNYDSWVKVASDWNTAFYFDEKNNLRVKLNLVGEKEVSAYGPGEGSEGSPGLITIVDNLTSTSAEAALSANMGRVLKQMIDEKTVNVDLSGYATQTWVRQQGYLTQHQSLANYPTRSEAWLTTDFSISDYAKKSEAWLTTDFSIYDYVTLDTSQTISGRKNFTSNVGIGVNSPTEKLDVGGNIKSENVYVTSVSGNHTIFIGNQNGVGANKPSMIQASNGNIYMGYGTSWTGGGTFTKILTITNDGKVGIGTETPSERLAVVGSINLNNSTTGGYKQGGIVVIRSNGTETVVGANQGTIHFRPSGHNMATAAYIDVNGNFVAKGEVTAYSDARLKYAVKTLDNRGYIRPVSYIKDGKESIGFLAQDVRRLYPELVHEDNSKDRYLSLNYAQYTAVLQAQIIELEKRIKKLEGGYHDYT